MTEIAHDRRTILSGIPGRAVFFFAFWILIAGIKPLDLAAGLVTALIAAAVSVRLLPPGPWRIRPGALGMLALRFLRQSVVAGFDVARRALDPRLPLRPGFVIYRPQSPDGPVRDAFCTMTSLLPGTLPAGSDGNAGVLVHCLDVDQPVAEQLAAEEALFRRAFGEAS